MPSTMALLSFSAAAFLLIVVPGPSVLFVVGRGFAYGRRVALFSAGGNALGEMVLVAVVAVGLGTVVAQFTALLTAVKLAGAAYLVFLGVQTIRHRRELVPSERQPPPSAGQGWRGLWDGFVVGATNPKSLIFFIAALPQFASPAAGSLMLQMLVFGVVFNLIAVACDTCYALLAGTMRRWFLLVPRRMEVTGAISGWLMIGLGAHLALTGRRPA
ncbi:threonine/homoserine/homoserine lactone efflux protein [Lipingzhangella halophila]|uniref:Threonine/homoserine/homoserine lactone efflux protein n=1 Tax=Lipingzhangella halophila TaxID=1783352 RepID=A0A7W7W4S6_9ACTN|nr:LysE family translocator [Lipingzhangella halophila]MBB4934482.1 threonine/homoserine/homoserine lactone efflux protein [Lipingzhangella halophila]